MNIVFLVFGDTLAYHMQTYFALLTVLRHKRGADSVVVYTDMPQYYNRLEGRISLHTLDKETLDSWINGTGYIFRAKIKAIEDCAARHGGSHILFLDGHVNSWSRRDEASRVTSEAFIFYLRNK